jgi:dephospho-CoA kinase
MAKTSKKGGFYHNPAMMIGGKNKDERGIIKMAMKLFLCGPKGVGKTTAARYLEYRYGAKVYVLAAPLYGICRDLFGMQEKNRKLLQTVGDALRSVDPEVFLKYALRKIEQDNPCFAVVEDVRLRQEADFLTRHGFIGIRLYVPDPIRAARLMARDGESVRDDHHTEKEAQNLWAPIIIDNNGSIEELERALDSLVELLGHSFVAINPAEMQERREG